MKTTDDQLMKLSAVSLLLLALTLPCVSFAQDVPVLANPDFEEGSAADPAPGWSIGRGGVVELTQDMPASGKNALVLKDGYDVISQNFENMPDLYRYKFRISVVASSPDAAAFGIRVGYYKMNDSGARVWVDRPVVWDKILGPDNQELIYTGSIPDDEAGGRFWIAFYRSQNEGTIVLDNVTLTFEPKE